LGGIGCDAGEIGLGSGGDLQLGERAPGGLGAGGDAVAIEEEEALGADREMVGVGIGGGGEHDAETAGAVPGGGDGAGERALVGEAAGGDGIGGVVVVVQQLDAIAGAEQKAGELPAIGELVFGLRLIVVVARVSGEGEVGVGGDDGGEDGVDDGAAGGEGEAAALAERALHRRR
jgi:hypothetical protein